MNLRADLCSMTLSYASGSGQPAQTSMPAYCETGRPISGEHLV